MPPHFVAGTEKMLIDESNCAAYNRAIVDLIPGAFCVLDLEGTIKFMNNHAMQMLGHDTLFAYIGKNLLEFIAPEDRRRVMDGLKRTLLKRVGSFSEYLLLRPDGKRIPIVAGSSLVLDETGEPMGFVCVAHNPQNIKQILSREYLASDRALFYLDIMSHDISNQLQVIMSAAELLLYKLKETEHEFLLFDILDSIKKCNRIIETSEIMERIISSATAERSLREAIHTALVQVIERQDVDVEAQLEIDDSIIMADEFLEQLLFAILDNACIHNNRVNKMIWIRTTEIDDGYSVLISDNGPGISHHMKSQLLDMQQRKGGLGLHLCRLISDKYGAKINICDRVDGCHEHGTRVELWFPKLAIR
ncbi:MAG: ATP-binding protein [Candidatus Thorarchaeota archaeon]